MNSNIVKTINYIKRNGLIDTVYAVLERISENKKADYTYKAISEDERLSQMADSLNINIKLSILVPTYETNRVYLEGMINSVISQTYSNWELIIADASSTDAVNECIKTYPDDRIKYIKLSKNAGISENSNEGLKHCNGEYICLLDHDDLLTVNALYEVAKTINDYRSKNIKPQMLYSDEDKTDGENTAFFEPNIKPKFNLDLILSNNYICHLMTVESTLIKELGFRKAYDGAQDHDLVLRIISQLRSTYGKEYEKYICHIDKVLYHWRCHMESTAANPKSKLYAYDAGRRAVEDYILREGIEAEVKELKHVGFFEIAYEPDIFSQRPEVIATGGRIVDFKGTVTGGIMDEEKRMLFKGLNRHNSGGILHRASCRMEIPYIDVRCMKLSNDGLRLYKEIKEKYKDNMDYEKLSIEFSEYVRKLGYKLVYDPNLIVRGK